ncbi:MAG: nicotinate-nicotinamide nucleotide adenylyltransferase [Oscillospiraceae bacterium]
MRIAVYGGSFNPPHPLRPRRPPGLRGAAARQAAHNPGGGPSAQAARRGQPGPAGRFELTRIAFRFPRGGGLRHGAASAAASYTSDTVAELAAEYPGAEIFFVIGTDMLTSFERWHNFRDILALSALAVLPRDEGDMPEIERCSRRFEELYGARIRVIDVAPLPMSSSEMRELLVSRRGADVLDGEVYARIIRCATTAQSRSSTGFASGPTPISSPAASRTSRAASRRPPRWPGAGARTPETPQRPGFCTISPKNSAWTSS